VIRRATTRFLAALRLSKRAICEASQGRGLYDDFHDYPDAKDGHPWHLTDLTCERCGKAFRI
jgi:hypothetical protein